MNWQNIIFLCFVIAIVLIILVETTPSLQIAVEKRFPMMMPARVTNFLRDANYALPVDVTLAKFSENIAQGTPFNDGPSMITDCYWEDGKLHCANKK